MISVRGRRCEYSPQTLKQPPMALGMLEAQPHPTWDLSTGMIWSKFRLVTHQITPKTAEFNKTMSKMRRAQNVTRTWDKANRILIEKWEYVKGLGREKSLILMWAIQKQYTGMCSGLSCLKVWITGGLMWKRLRTNERQRNSHTSYEIASFSTTAPLYRVGSIFKKRWSPVLILRHSRRSHAYKHELYTDIK